MRKVQKLVRDQTATIMRREGRIANTRTLSQSEAIARLKDKLDEEVQEYKDGPSRHEVADILTVLFALAREQLGLTQEQCLEAMRAKERARGAFNERLWLEETDDPYTEGARYNE